MISLLQPSTKELIDIGGSKYAVVVAVSKRARAVSEFKKNDDSYRLSSIVSEVLDELMSGKVEIAGVPDYVEAEGGSPEMESPAELEAGEAE